MKDFMKNLGIYFLVGLAIVLALLLIIYGFQVNMPLTIVIISLLIMVAFFSKELGIIGGIASIIAASVLFGCFHLFKYLIDVVGKGVVCLTGEVPLLTKLSETGGETEKTVGFIFFICLLLLYIIGRQIYKIVCFFIDLKKQAKNEEIAYGKKVWQTFVKGLFAFLRYAAMFLLFLAGIAVLIVILMYGIELIYPELL